MVFENVLKMALYLLPNFFFIRVSDRLCVYLLLSEKGILTCSGRAVLTILQSEESRIKYLE